MGPLTASLRKWRESGEKKEKVLEELARLEGVYVPQFYEANYRPEGLLESFSPRGDFPARVKRAWLPDLDDSLTLSAVTTPHTELSGMLLAELSRGCRRGCRFCAGSYTYFPHRVREGALLAEAVLQRAAPGEKVGLVGAAISDYPDLLPLGKKILESEKVPSFSSLRVDSLTSDLAKLVAASGQKTVTLAPEAGSERMRRIVRKGFTEEEILRAAEILHDQGIRNFRLYFMIGLPAEGPGGRKGDRGARQKNPPRSGENGTGGKRAARGSRSASIPSSPSPAPLFSGTPLKTSAGCRKRSK